MKNKYSLLLLFIAFCCLSVQCKKDEKTELEKLPPITSYGAYTFGCLINGKAWPMSIGTNNLRGEIGYQNFYYNGRLDIECFYRKDPFISIIDENVYFRTNDITGPGLYKISFKDSKNDNFSVIIGSKKYYNSRYEINQNGHAFVNILRFDTVAHIVSGTFQFALFDEQGLTYVTVENGRFDQTS